MQDLDHARNLMAMAQKDFVALRAMANIPLFADENIRISRIAGARKSSEGLAAS